MKQGFLAKPNCAANQMMTRAAKKRPKPKPIPPPPPALPPSPYTFKIPVEIQNLVNTHGPKASRMQNLSSNVKSSVDLRNKEPVIPSSVARDFEMVILPDDVENTDNNGLFENMAVEEVFLPESILAQQHNDASSPSLEHPPGFGPITRPLPLSQPAAMGSTLQSGCLTPTWSSLFKNKPRNAGRLVGLENLLQMDFISK